MIKFQNQDITVWQSIKDSLSKKLNYWVECRNDLIHRAEGVSKATMQAMLDSDRAANKTEAKSACEPDEILSEMVNIRSQIFKLLEQSDNDFQNEDFYYIYTEIKHQVLTDLQFDSK